MAKRPTERVKFYCKDRVKSNSIAYYFSIKDFYKFYQYHQDEMVKHTKYNSLMRDYFKGLRQVWIENPDYSLVPGVSIGKLILQRVICNKFCPLTKYEQHIKTQFDLVEKRNISLKFLLSGGYRWCIKWFNRYPHGYFSNNKLYVGKPVKPFELLIQKMV